MGFLRLNNNKAYTNYSLSIKLLYRALVFRDSENFSEVRIMSYIGSDLTEKLAL